MNTPLSKNLCDDLWCPNRILGAILAVIPAFALGTPVKLNPTFSNVEYGHYERNTLDFWQAQADKPSSLVIFIHGGGFVSGSKEQLRPELLRKLLKNGISVAALNYRYANQFPLPAAYQDVARATQFLRSQADAWKLDKTRVCAFGNSAGAQLAMYLAFHDDMAIKASQDPIERESTRLSCVGSLAGQVTLNPDWMAAHVPEFQRGGLDDRQILGAKTTKEWMKKADQIAALTFLSADDPPVFMSYQMGPNEPYPADRAKKRGWMIHHVAHGVELKKACDRLGMECYLHYPGADVKYKGLVDFFVAKLLHISK